MERIYDEVTLQKKKKRKCMTNRTDNYNGQLRRSVGELVWRYQLYMQVFHGKL